ncbi:SDR family oxidoreductase [Actinoplanes sp. NBRC 103695]|uniref:SDR family NAD(P)-dependent oxidoreductase n=1 Tax=Actinoplanes sp. NBRC 103695 TaxID=3032202 RepID=UPI0024A27DE4|nr:SDR family oxidoreductase [Actinoplanes sp. NBRC 103695]GLZ02156.1 3-oxoacyl-ACP reductase [Actinoplanes sp. NBRC 103695]
MSLDGKIALVTGGSRGIGRAVVERLARDGAQVYYTCRTEPRLLGATGIRADHEDVGSVEAMVAAVGDRLDILVNNAAINPGATLAEVSAPEFDRVLTVNAKVPVLAMRAAAERMGPGGRIVNLSTLNTVVPAPGHLLYTMSKGALEQATAVASRELGPRGITVNTVSPGAVETDMLRSVNSPEALVQTAALTALRRLGRPGDIADVVAWLAGPDAGWVTGQNLRATGGLLV